MKERFLVIQRLSNGKCYVIKVIFMLTGAVAALVSLFLDIYFIIFDDVDIIIASVWTLISMVGAKLFLNELTK